MKNLKIKIYSDGANIEEIVQMNENIMISGFTTNPTLMKSAGITNYLKFANEVLSKVKKKPISFEVFSDDLEGMYRQAMILKSLGDNVWVKIPISNTKKEYTYQLIKKLSNEGVKLNITALFTEDQISKVFSSLNSTTKSILSIFAGRIANAGVDPEPIMTFASDLVSNSENIQTLWASSREVFNIIQAERCGTDIITLTPSLINSMKDLGKDLTEFSLETVKMFYNDAIKSGFNF